MAGVSIYQDSTVSYTFNVFVVSVRLHFTSYSLLRTGGLPFSFGSTFSVLSITKGVAMNRPFSFFLVWRKLKASIEVAKRTVANRNKRNLWFRNILACCEKLQREEQARKRVFVGSQFQLQKLFSVAVGAGTCFSEACMLFP